MENEKQRIGFIGAGNMAEAMIGAMLRSRLFAPADIMVSDIDSDRLAYLNRTHGTRPAANNAEIVRGSTMVVFAIKPQQVHAVLEDLSRARAFDAPEGRKRFVSIAAGIRIRTFEEYIYANAADADVRRMPILRVMPNTPALVGAGMCALCGNAHATSADLEEWTTLLSAMGRVLVCEEAKMDAVTALSGSGPAYCFYMIEAMMAAGERLGLSAEEAEELTVATLSGALKLLEIRKEPAESLRRKVTSPGGTTEAALQTLDEHGWTSAMIEAIAAAARRSRQLSGLD